MYTMYRTGVSRNAIQKAMLNTKQCHAFIMYIPRCTIHHYYLQCPQVYKLIPKWERDITLDRSSTPGSPNSWKEAPGNYAACSSRMLTHRYTRYQHLMQGIFHSLSFHAFYEPMKLQVFIFFIARGCWVGCFWICFEVAQASFDPSTVRNSVQIGPCHGLQERR